MLMNYVALVEGTPTRLHFTDDYMVDRDITDPVTKKPKRVTSLVLQVDEVNGKPDSRTFSVLSQQLASQLQPYLAGKAYRNWTFEITKVGGGFTARFQMKVEPRPKTV
jgi:hypothetical protein